MSPISFHALQPYPPVAPGQRKRPNFSAAMPMPQFGKQNDRKPSITLPVQIHKYRDPFIGLHKDNGYFIEGSRLLEPYHGPTNKTEGYSTSPGAVALLKERSWQVPISTCGAANCAIAIFYDDAKKKHGLIHDFSYGEGINPHYARDIYNYMPTGFNRVVFIPGRTEQTASSVNSFLRTILQVNPDVELEFRHFPATGLEVASYQGKPSFIPAKPGEFKATFTIRNDSHH